jgi:hypothetical protein
MVKNFSNALVCGYDVTGIKWPGAAAKVQMLAVLEAMFLLLVGGLWY